jgi:transposase
LKRIKPETIVYIDESGVDNRLNSFLLSEIEAGTTIVMNNASFHKSRETKELIEKHACKLLFLPPYSPELNPIEYLWHVLKSKLKKDIKES